jgi:hypothetical protein
MERSKPRWEVERVHSCYVCEGFDFVRVVKGGDKVLEGIEGWELFLLCGLGFRY